MDTIKQLLEALKELGFNPLYVLAIIFATYVAKSFDEKDQLKQGYVLFPLIFSFILFWFNKPIIILDYIVNSFTHAALGAYGYNIYSKLIKKQKETE